MKIAFDENIPAQMVRVFRALGQEKRFKRDKFEFYSAVDYTPKPTDSDYSPKNDVPWLNRFAADNGKVVISGDVKMSEVPHELEALRRHGFVVFFFERKWMHWKFHQKIALLQFHWPEVSAKIKAAKAGEFWRIPNQFAEGKLRNVTPGAKEIEKTNPKVAGGKVQATRKRSGSKLDGSRVQPDRESGRKGGPRAPPDQRQAALELQGGGPKTPSPDPEIKHKGPDTQ